MKNVSWIVKALLLLSSLRVIGQQTKAPPLLGFDDRYKIDLLLVVAHPDDESGDIAGYLARLIYDQHRRVAIVFVNQGQDGDNEAGPEEGNALGIEREIEGRRAVASLGIVNVWFLGAPNVSTQNVINSLERWGHGAVLEQLVRLVRLTRPEVILTWLPAFVAGENHADHQAASVIANEAFDMAGDPALFSEQLVPDRSGGQSAECLLPWQPKKIYYYSDSLDYADYGEKPQLPSPYRKPLLEGWGPVYSNTEISSTQHVSYSRLAAKETSFYLTQGGKAGVEAIAKQDFTEFERPTRLIFGKSLVGGTISGEVFDGIVPGAFSAASAPRRQIETSKEVSLDLGGPWNFYHAFWKAHNIERLADLLPVPEMAIGADTHYIRVPLLIRNDTSAPQEITLSVQLPEGWSSRIHYTKYELMPGQIYPVVAVLTPSDTSNPRWCEITWKAQAIAHRNSIVTLRVYVGAKGAMPQ